MPWNIAPTETDIVAIHVAPLPTADKGELLIFGDCKSPTTGTTHTRIYTIDPESGANPSNLPSQNLFCGGQAFLADGRLLIAGGTTAWPEVPGDEDLPPATSRTGITTAASAPATSICRGRRSSCRWRT